MVNKWWVWVGGAILLGLAGSMLLGGLLAVIGVIIGGIFALLKVTIGVVFSLVGAVLGSFVNLLFLAGAGYLGYRWWQRRSLKNSQTSWARGTHE